MQNGLVPTGQYDNLFVTGMLSAMRRTYCPSAQAQLQGLTSLSTGCFASDMMHSFMATPLLVTGGPFLTRVDVTAVIRGDKKCVGHVTFGLKMHTSLLFYD